MNKPAAFIIVAGATLMLASPTLNDFLGRWEGGGVQVVYADRLANGLPTVCKGITKHVTKVDIVVGDYWDELKCEEIEDLVIKQTQTQLAKCIKHRVSQGTFDALSSMSHNVGVGSVCASRAVGLINAGRLVEGCKAISQAPDGTPVWSYVSNGKGGKRFIQGLQNRRRAETALCLRDTM